MATTRKPGFSTPRDGEWKILAQAIDTIRERLGQIDVQVTQALALVGGNQTAQQIQVLQAQVAQLSARVSALAAGAGSTLTNLLAQPNGFVVVRDGQFITRVLIGENSINILYPDGHDADPIIFLGITTGASDGDGWAPPAAIRVPPVLATRQPWWGVSEDRV